MSSAGARAIRRPGARGARTSYPTVESRPSVTEVTGTGIWPKPVFEAHGTDATFFQVGGADVAATSPDCPYLTHGDATDLASCEKACAGDGSCNLINWNPAIDDCVLRQCADPAHPELTPTPGYTVYATVRGYYSVDPASFAFLVVGAQSRVLSAGVARYRTLAFPYPSPSPGAAGGRRPLRAAPVSGLLINVTTTDETLRLATNESYTLTVTADAATGQPLSVLTAPTAFGALRGLETFAQLLQFNLTDGSYAIQETVIRDEPRFPFRGVLVDTARRYMAPSVLRAVVDAMAAVKLNVLHIHLNDDQSWPLEIKGWPRLAGQGAYSNHSHTYTHEDVTGLVQYALERGVRVIPEFDSPSHFGTLEHSYKEFTATAYDSDNNTFACLVDPSRPETFDFLASVWGEIASIFPDEYLGIGGDEWWECWNEAPLVKAWMDARNMTAIDTYYYYERNMIGIARSLGRKSLAWLDIAGYPTPWKNNYNDYADVTLNVWTGCYSGNWQEDTATFVAQNASVVISGPFYVTQQNGAPTTPHFTWQQMYATDLANFTGSGRPGAMAHVQGGELCVWDDAAQTDSGDLLVSITPYLLGVGEAFWSPQAVTSGHAPDESRAHVHRCRMVQRGQPSHPIYAFGTLCPYEYEAPAGLAAGVAWDGPSGAPAGSGGSVEAGGVEAA